MGPYLKARGSLIVLPTVVLKFSLSSTEAKSEREGEQERNDRGGRPEGEEKRQLEGRSDAKIFYTTYTISYLYQ